MFKLISMDVSYRYCQNVCIFRMHLPANRNKYVILTFYNRNDSDLPEFQLFLKQIYVEQYAI